MQVDIDGMLIESFIVQEDGSGHAAAVHDMSPIAVGIRTVGLELVDHRQDGPSYHRGP